MKCFYVHSCVFNILCVGKRESFSISRNFSLSEKIFLLHLLRFIKKQVQVGLFCPATLRNLSCSVSWLIKSQEKTFFN